MFYDYIGRLLSYNPFTSKYLKGLSGLPTRLNLLCTENSGSLKCGKVKFFHFPGRHFAMPETHIGWKDLIFPQLVYESLGRIFYPCIIEFYDNEENKKAFEECMKNKVN